MVSFLQEYRNKLRDICSLNDGPHEYYQVSVDGLRLNITESNHRLHVEMKKYFL